MTKEKIKQSVENFKNIPGDHPYLVLVAGGTPGAYFTGQEFCDNTGAGFNRELVGIKQADGSIHFFGSMKHYEDD